MNCYFTLNSKTLSTSAGALGYSKVLITSKKIKETIENQPKLNIPPLMPRHISNLYKKDCFKCYK